MACKKDGSMDDAIKKCVENMNHVTKLFTTISGNEKEYSVELAARDFAFAIAEIYTGNHKNLFEARYVGSRA